MKTVTLSTLQAYKRAGETFSCLTAYDASFAHAASAAGIDVLLVGDSLGMVLQGHSSTLPVTIDDICYHTRCAARGKGHSLLMVDLPFMSNATTERLLEAIDETTRIVPIISIQKMANDFEHLHKWATNEDARKAVTLFNKTNTPILGIIENMSYFIAPDTGKRYDIFRSGGGRATAERLGVPLIAEVPIDMSICEGGDAGLPAAAAASSSPQREAFVRAGREVAKLISVQNLTSGSGPVIESN